MIRVKICGIRRWDDALRAVKLGADALGFVFWPESPRFIDPYRALPIVTALPPFVATVGVFVDQAPEYVKGVAQLLNLSAIQLHGQETPSSYPRHRRVIKSVAVTDSFEPVAAFAALPPRATVLLDAHDPIRRGGTGQVIDWSRAAAAARVRPVILSGGLTPGNVGAAITTVGPYAVDVSSGVEAEPGVKDAAKLRAFFTALAAVAAPQALEMEPDHEVFNRQP